MMTHLFLEADLEVCGLATIFNDQMEEVLVLGVSGQSICSVTEEAVHSMPRLLAGCQ